MTAQTGSQHGAVPREKIPIGADHAGFAMKEQLKRELDRLGYEAVDLGARSEEASDYPEFAHSVAQKISTGEARRGILLCGSGIGMDIVANRYPGVRAALAWQPAIAELSRKHNDSNVLVLPSRFMSDADASAALGKWLSTEFEGGRHQRRVEQIESAKGARQ
ncbi:MAG TPA: ribose 5-phosphate isomerase B [Gemmatimonadaceae bacterium]|nr:ribose 5-phosphate isomerase B [Gemmatimonadaceae bacterium]